MENQKYLECAARQYKSISFWKAGNVISVLLSVPLMGASFEFGSKTIGGRLENGDSFLNISFGEFAKAKRGTVRFDDKGNPRIVPF